MEPFTSDHPWASNNSNSGQFTGPFLRPNSLLQAHPTWDSAQTLHWLDAAQRAFASRWNDQSDERTYQDTPAEQGLQGEVEGENAIQQEVLCVRRSDGANPHALGFGHALGVGFNGLSGAGFDYNRAQEADVSRANDVGAFSQTPGYQQNGLYPINPHAPGRSASRFTSVRTIPKKRGVGFNGISGADFDYSRAQPTNVSMRDRMEAAFPQTWYQENGRYACTNDEIQEQWTQGGNTNNQTGVVQHNDEDESDEDEDESDSNPDFHDYNRDRLDTDEDESDTDQDEADSDVELLDSEIGKTSHTPGKSLGQPQISTSAISTTPTEHNSSGINKAALPTSKSICTAPDPVRDLSPLLREHRNMHRHAAQLVPRRRTAPHRYCVAILNHRSSQHHGTNTAKNYLWLEGSRLTTVQTLWHAYFGAYAEDGFVPLLGRERVGWEVTMEECDLFADRLVVLRAVREEVNNAMGEMGWCWGAVAEKALTVGEAVEIIDVDD